ncbi:sugar transferase [Lacrimispora sp.]
MGYDPRVIKVGRFLRSTSIDKLPQFSNGLREMDQGDI